MVSSVRIAMLIGAALLVPGTIDAGQNPAPPAETPGVRPDGVSLGDAVQVGGYGSVRFETNSLEDPKPSGFDFRRFVLTTDVRPHGRLQAYVEIEFERLGEIEVERTVERSPDAIKFKQELEGGHGGELSIEQMWGQFNLADTVSARAGAILPPLGRFNISHDDDRWEIPRRSLADRGAPVLPVHAAWTELGAGLLGGADVGTTGRLTYQAYVVNGATLDFTVENAVEAAGGAPAILKLASELALARGPVNGEGGARAGTWRLGYSPTLSSEIAVSGYHGRYTPAFLQPVSERINALAVDGILRRGGFAVEGEWVRSDFGDVDRVLQGFTDAITGPGGIAPAAGAEGTEVEFAIKDLAPVRHGFWVEARYRFWPESWRGGILGRGFENPQLTPVFRYERVTFDETIDELAIENGEIQRGDRQTLQQERATVGVSYRPVPSVAFSAAIEHNRRIEGDVLVSPRVATDSYTTFLAGMAFGF